MSVTLRRCSSSESHSALYGAAHFGTGVGRRGGAAAAAAEVARRCDACS
eukprot:CAMPEP_0182940464 /NCGR_PEP_ID=MMETSP0105_2-20130417/47354_1 /TAXON_ID=81532 ORGANISM="Acanthoeca-like sp., Strain 10tr" /NCGR_SAMPLE_ID=MMETSP0105_2 /ASSEMBLY_ACC=CAM_ASM_000205 /LENGTH=48 /DNA_ID= /DNA_START= /DNA_END= /DNA_ORIENTATION=